MNLSSLNTDGYEFFEKNDIDLTCPNCKGSGEIADVPDGVKVVEYDPTDEEIEQHALDESNQHYTIEGITDDHDEALKELKGKIYDDEKEADDDLKEACGTEHCRECESGTLTVVMTTIYNTGFSADGRKMPQSFNGIVAFEYNDEIWLGMSGGGMDMTPYFLQAWMELFPDCSWLPDNFIDPSNLSWIEKNLSKEETDKVLTMIQRSVETTLGNAKRDLKNIKEFIALRKAENAPKKPVKKRAKINR